MPYLSSIVLPDSGTQEREHTDVQELRLYLLSCYRMGASLNQNFSVTFDGRDITSAIRSSVIKEILRQR